ncbi:hypothetical protein ACSV5M_06460 [Cellvibrio sp. ARAG 10.3]|uniref:hypothetical protein n=1 Tax=Cellvibrio sp. ARAG 10.3 TaxID=3451358 RepID=UPI003F44710B
MSNLDGFAISMTMGEWVLIMESIITKLKEINSLDPDSIDDDTLADLYTDQQNLEGIFEYIKIEFEKKYGSLPPNLSHNRQ